MDKTPEGTRPGEHERSAQRTREGSAQAPEGTLAKTGAGPESSARKKRPGSGSRDLPNRIVPMRLRTVCVRQGLRGQSFLQGRTKKRDAVVVFPQEALSSVKGTGGSIEQIGGKHNEKNEACPDRHQWAESPTSVPHTLLSLVPAGPLLPMVTAPFPPSGKTAPSRHQGSSSTRRISCRALHKPPGTTDSDRPPISPRAWRGLSQSQTVPTDLSSALVCLD